MDRLEVALIVMFEDSFKGFRRYLIKMLNNNAMPNKLLNEAFSKRAAEITMEMEREVLHLVVHTYRELSLDLAGNQYSTGQV